MKFQMNRRIIIGVVSVVVLLGVGLISAFAQGNNTQAMRLRLGDIVVDGIDMDTSSQQFLFNTFEGHPTMIIIESMMMDEGPELRINDILTGQMVAIVNSPSTASCLRLPPGGRDFVLELRHSQSGTWTQPYGVALMPVENTQLGCPEESIAKMMGEELFSQLLETGGVYSTVNNTLTLNGVIDNISSGSCKAGPSGFLNVNVRNRPSMNSSVVGNLSGEASGSVIGTVPEGTWQQVDTGSATGWVATAVVSNSGDCSTVPTLNVSPSGETSSALGEALNLTNLVETLTPEELADMAGIIQIPQDIADISVDDGIIHVGNGDTGISVDASDGGVQVNGGDTGINVSTDDDGGVQIDGGDTGGSVDVDDGGVNINLDDDDGNDTCVLIVCAG